MLSKDIREKYRNICLEISSLREHAFDFERCDLDENSHLGGALVAWGF